MDELEFLLEVAIQNPHYRPIFYEKIMNFDLYITTDYSSVINGRISEGYSIFVRSLKKENGVEIIPFFSSEAKLLEFEGESVPFISIKGYEFFDIIRGYGAVMNPGFEVSKEFSMREIELMADGKIFQPKQEIGIKSGSKIIISTPEEYPEEMADRLRNLFKMEHEVEKAYIFQYSNLEEEKKNVKYMVVIKTNGDFEKEAGKAIITIEGSLNKNVRVDFIKYDSKTGIEESVENEFEPFYIRSE
jgi:hypothetical protein